MQFQGRKLENFYVLRQVLKHWAIDSLEYSEFKVLEVAKRGRSQGGSGVKMKLGS